MNAIEFMEELKIRPDVTDAIITVRFAAIFALMDDEIREELHNQGFENDWEFLKAYCDKHYEKYGEEFTI